MILFSAISLCSTKIHFICFTAESDPNEEELEEKEGVKKESGACIKQEKETSVAGVSVNEKKDGQCAVLKLEKDPKEAQRAKELKISESELVRDLKTQLK